MLLLIADIPACTLRSALSKAREIATFLLAGAPVFPKSLESALDDASLEIAVIECVVDDHQGLTLIKKIKKHRSDVAIIFVCSSDSDHTVTEAFRLGARDCFKKPVDVLRLRERIKVLRKLKSISREKRIPFHQNGQDETCSLKLLSITTDAPDNILRVINHIEDHLLDRSLSIERLAGIAGMSPFHFCRVFKKHTAKTPMQFIACLRVEKAKGLLKYNSANMPVSLVATTVGFYDSSNFIKHFKKETGLTPTAFKTSNKSAVSK
jgi:AraC-like DNA-binding protein/ActR/RegA family two-component response regulator